ncbi:MAG TPA: HAD family hydrolase [Actinomycetota bacterium]|nr:HAD family hydrolase [Actinomycetota bacterium]
MRGDRPAVFLDRDGTLIEDPGHLGDPDGVVLLPGVAAALRRLAAASFALVVVSNQAGVARGIFTEAAVRAVNRRLGSLLDGDGVHLDAFYVCPHHPEFTGPCECRKPGTKMLEDAAAELGLDLGASWIVGDQGTDAEAGRRAGARPVLVRTGDGTHEAVRVPRGVPVVADLAVAAALILGDRPVSRG